MQQGGFFAPLPQRRDMQQDRPTLAPRRGWTTEAVYADWIRGLIAEAEAGAAGPSLIVPTVQYGNILLLPQPARGWGEDAEKLYHAQDLAPHHQYVATYTWLKHAYRADAVIHVAGVVNAPDRAGFAAGNIEGTRAMLNAAQAADVRRFVHVSSLAAREPELSDYGWSKAQGDKLVKASPLHWSTTRKWYSWTSLLQG